MTETGSVPTGQCLPVETQGSEVASHWPDSRTSTPSSSPSSLPRPLTALGHSLCVPCPVPGQMWPPVGERWGHAVQESTWAPGTVAYPWETLSAPFRKVPGQLARPEGWTQKDLG